MNIQEVIKLPEYSFITSDEHLGSNIAFLTFGGSHAYGTNVEGSDVDVRGCTLNPKSDLIGLTCFEQFMHEPTDTVIYAFNKLIGLLVNCNPNVIEMLGCKPEHYAMVSKCGQKLIDNKKLFLSRVAAHSFGGYAVSQLRRLQNNLARHTVSEELKYQHIAQSCNLAMESFNQRFKEIPSGSIAVYSEEDELYIDFNVKKYPLSDGAGIIKELGGILKSYEKINHRNKKKDDIHLNKHAMHLVRLYLMCIDILESESIITYREKDHDMLMGIRNGKYQEEDGTMSEEFFAMIDDLEKQMNYALANTSLPEKPNMKTINNFVMEINDGIVKGIY